MRIAHTATPLPRRFTGQFPGIVLEADVTVTPGARIAAKLLVFRNNAAMRTFWRRALGCRGGRAICRRTLGAVHTPATEWTEHPSEQKWMEVDRRYFCVIGLIQTHLTMEVITHEAGHAAFAYVSRQRRIMFEPARQHDEEGICYPLGIIARGINMILCDAGLYPRTKVAPRPRSRFTLRG